MIRPKADFRASQLRQGGRAGYITCEESLSAVLIVPPAVRSVFGSDTLNMGMLFQFDSPEVRSICEDQNAALQMLGDDAELLFAALADLRAVSNLADLPAGILNSEPGNAQGFYLVAGHHKLVFSQNHKVAPTDDGGKINLKKVARIKILRIDHND